MGKKNKVVIFDVAEQHNKMDPDLFSRYAISHKNTTLTGAVDIYGTIGRESFCCCYTYFLYCSQLDCKFRSSLVLFGLNS